MSREKRIREVVKTHMAVVDDTVITCDRCGGTWTQEELEQEPEEAPVSIMLVSSVAPAEYVRLQHGDTYRITLDYCPACAEIIWENLCQVVGTNGD
jgi:Zn-finger nucleic acid-binding protein